jgi:hypothetical protein
LVAFSQRSSLSLRDVVSKTPRNSFFLIYHDILKKSKKLHKKDEELLKLIQSYFGCGNIYKDGEDSLVLKIVDIKQIINTLITHFDKYPLQTQKKADFILFKKIVGIIHRKEHLTSNGIQEIVNLKASLNLGVSDYLKAIFPTL